MLHVAKDMSTNTNERQNTNHLGLNIIIMDMVHHNFYKALFSPKCWILANRLSAILIISTRTSLVCGIVYSFVMFLNSNLENLKVLKTKITQEVTPFICQI